MKVRPNMILVVLDTLRKDTLDNNLERLPNIRYLLDRSTCYQNAISPASWTVPAHASMLTGLYPIEHKMVCRYDDAAFFKGIANLPARATTLQERLHGEGYNTVSVSANPLVGKGTAFDAANDYSETVGPFRLHEVYGNAMDEIIGMPKRGILGTGIKKGMSNFEFIRKYGPRKTFQLMWLLFQERRGLRQMNFPIEKGSRQVLGSFKNLVLEEPFFAFVNLMEMHEPYESVAEFGQITQAYVMGELSKDFTRAKQYDGDLRQVKKELVRNLVVVDEWLGEMIRHLKDKGYFDRTAIVITSDHGQSLGEDDYVGHTYLLNDGIVNVPLIVKSPMSERRSVDRYVSTLDIYNLLLLASEEGIWEYPKADYIFSEAFGFHKSGWMMYAGHFYDTHLPQIRKRIWGKDGHSLTVNGTTGAIENFSIKEQTIDSSQDEQKVQELLNELELFIGRDDFKLPSGS